MGLYRLLPVITSFRHHVYKSTVGGVASYLYYYQQAGGASSAGGRWVIGPKIAAASGGLFVVSAAPVPEQIESASSDWLVYTGKWTTVGVRVNCV